MRDRSPVRFGSFLVTSLVVSVLLGCQPTDQAQMQQAAVDTAAVQSAVDSLRQAFLNAYNAGEANQLASLYTDDAVVLPGDAPPVSTRDSIRAYFTSDSERVNRT